MSAAAPAFVTRSRPRTARDWDRANAQHLTALVRAQTRRVETLRAAQRAADLRAATQQRLAERAQLGAAAARAHAATSRRRRVVDFAESVLVTLAGVVLICGLCVILAALVGGRS